MAVYLKCLLLGDEKTGKSSLGRLLSAGKKVNNCYEATAVDPSTKAQVIFRIEEKSDLPEDAAKAACAMVVYNSTDADTFEAVKDKYIPFLTKKMNADSSFIMLIGTHADQQCSRVVDPFLAEEYAACNSLFHMEVSNTLKKNIDLTLKVMRIRASYLVKKHPEIAHSTRSTSPVLRTGKPPEIDFSALSEEQESRESPSPTPQFSERHHGRKHSFEVKEEDVLNQCGNFSFPLQETGFNVLQMRKKTRYDETLGDPSTIDTGNNLSFANMSGISDHEDGDIDYLLSLENRPQPSKSKEFTLQGEGLLDSQPRSGKMLPVVPLLNIGNGSQTERRSLPPSRNQQVGGSTDRPGNRMAVMEITVSLGRNMTSKASIYEGDSAIEVAQRILGDLEDAEQITSDLAVMIEDNVRQYCTQIQGVKRQPSVPVIRHIVSERTIQQEVGKSPGKIDLKRSESEKPRMEVADTPRKLLFKVKVNIGDRRCDVIVRSGDDLPSVAHSFSERNNVLHMESQIRDLLYSAYERYKQREV